MDFRARILVIDADAVGCSTAHHLARAGVRAALANEQGPLLTTGGSSSQVPSFDPEMKPMRC